MKTAARRLGIPPDEYATKVAAGLKWCGRCRGWHPIEQFGIDLSRTDGRAAACLTSRRVVERKPRGPSPLRGKKMSAESRQKMSVAAKARGSNRTGVKHTAETRALISERTRAATPRGEACHSYKDGKFAERMGERFSAAYKRWRFDVYSRDGFTCQRCGDDRGGNLHAHHIKAFADYEELRLVVSNGITLCEDCHRALHAGEWSLPEE